MIKKYIYTYIKFHIYVKIQEKVKGEATFLSSFCSGLRGWEAILRAWDEKKKLKYRTIERLGIWYTILCLYLIIYMFPTLHSCFLGVNLIQNQNRYYRYKVLDSSHFGSPENFKLWNWFRMSLDCWFLHTWL